MLAEDDVDAAALLEYARLRMRVQALTQSAGPVMALCHGKTAHRR
jgi:hypothetical protein